MSCKKWQKLLLEPASQNLELFAYEIKQYSYSCLKKIAEELLLA